MQISFAPRILEHLRGDESLFAADIDVRERAMTLARQSRDTRVRPAVPTARQIRRQRHRDVVATGKKSRRAAFRRQKTLERQEQLLRTWARVYLDGRGNDDVRRNVTEAVHRQAEEYSKKVGEPFERSLKRVEGELMNARIREAAGR